MRSQPRPATSTSSPRPPRSHTGHRRQGKPPRTGVRPSTRRVCAAEIFPCGRANVIATPPFPLRGAPVLGCSPTRASRGSRASVAAVRARSRADRGSVRAVAPVRAMAAVRAVAAVHPWLPWLPWLPCDAWTGAGRAACFSLFGSERSAAPLGASSATSGFSAWRASSRLEESTASSAATASPCPCRSFAPSPGFARRPFTELPPGRPAADANDAVARCVAAARRGGRPAPRLVAATTCASARPPAPGLLGRSRRVLVHQTRSAPRVVMIPAGSVVRRDGPGDRPRVLERHDARPSCTALRSRVASVRDAEPATSGRSTSGRRRRDRDRVCGPGTAFRPSRSSAKPSVAARLRRHRRRRAVRRS